MPRGSGDDIERGSSSGNGRDAAAGSRGSSGGGGERDRLLLAASEGVGGGSMRLPLSVQAGGAVAAAASQLGGWRTTCERLPPAMRLTLLLCLIFVSTALAQYLDATQLQLLIEGMQHARLGSTLLFVLLFAAAVVLLLPGSLLSIGAGAAYGFSVGSVVAWCGTVTGQLGAFMLGRYLLRDLVVAHALKRVPGFAAMDANVSRDGWKLVLLLRLSPLVPYNLSNYALGITSIHVVPYTVCSGVAAVPYACLFAYLGSMSTDIYTLLHDGARAQLSPQWLIAAVCCMVLSMVGLFFVCRRAITAVPNGGGGGELPGARAALRPQPAMRAA